VALECFQSNHEGALVDRIHAARGHADGILINAGAFTHTSIALRDAVATLTSPIIEVHLSHTYARESFRRSSLLAPYTRGTVSGLGWLGYRLAIEGLLAASS
jgi:3-dehydroquinate dehydratase-2